MSTNTDPKEEIMELNYSMDEWKHALEAAQNNDWDPIDTEQEAGPLGQWICDQAIDHKSVEQDGGVLWAALDAMGRKGEGAFSPERLITVLDMYNGDSGDDFTDLIEEHAEDRGLLVAGKIDDPEKWYMANAARDGEFYGRVPEGGTLHWFDENKLSR